MKGTYLRHIGWKQYIQLFISLTKLISDHTVTRPLMNFGLVDLPQSSIFKVFGSKCYIKNNDENIGKYDDRVDEGVFLGYATNSKGYRCYNKRLHKLVDCIDIKVDEEIPLRNVSNVEPRTKDTVEDEDEQVQGLEREESGSDEDTNIQTDTDKQKEGKSPLRIIRKNHPENKIIGDINEGVQT
jgi:hypothetical protein